MINLSILISSSEVSGPGGLFDINATLPLVAIQFILLMVILNIILYSPLLTIIEERKEYILSHLAEASNLDSIGTPQGSKAVGAGLCADLESG